MHEVDVYLFSLPPLNICSDGLLFRVKWESRCQRCHLLKNDETDWRMRPGWCSNLKARELINLSAGVANVGIKAQTQIVMEQMKVEVVSAENVPRGRNQVQRSHRHRLLDGAAMIRRQNQHVPDSSYQCPRKTAFSRTSARWGRHSQHTPRPYSLLRNHIDVGKIRIPLYFLDKNQSVLCWWSEPTKRKSHNQSR